MELSINFAKWCLFFMLQLATAGVERVLSIMNLIKNKRRSKMGQRYLIGCFVT
jgi:hypothetical protein